MIKLIACDLDGTLLNDHHVISSCSKAILPKLQRHGMQFMVASGRMYEGVISMFEGLLPDCEYLLLNGALITQADGRPIEEIQMTKQDIASVHEIFTRHDLCYHMFTDIGTITNDAQRSTEQFIDHLRRQQQSEEVIRQLMEETNFCKYAKEVSDMDAFLEEDISVYKMEAFGADAQTLEAARTDLTQLSTIAVTNSIEENIEVTDCHAQKGLSLQRYCEHHHIAKDEVVVLGDSLNDLSMIEQFPHSVAMKNAQDCIKKAAACISSYTNDEDGAAYVLEQIIQRNK